MKIDFFGTRVHYRDHLAPVWDALSENLRAGFYGDGLIPTGTNPLLVCAYGDLQKAYSMQPRRKFIFMEHGVGLTFNQAGYAGGLGLRRRVDLFLAPNEFIRAKTARVFPNVRQVVVGTPKLDPVASWRGADDVRMKLTRPVVCISFHWDGSKIAPEAGNAFRYYRNVLSELAKQKDFKLIGHGHPRIIDELRPIYEAAGIEVVEDFQDVLRTADLYVNDCSSTMYEFCVTGKPVIVLNAPWFRRSVHFGLRFWEYDDVGPQVNQPEELLPAIKRMLQGPDDWIEARRKAVRDLYPCLGVAAETAAKAILEFTCQA